MFIPKIPLASFFDDVNSTFTFKSFSPKQQPQELSSPPLLISPITCNDLSNGACLKGTFSLYKSLLVFEGVSFLIIDFFIVQQINYSKSRQKYLDLACSKLKILSQSQSTKTLGLEVTKNGQSYELLFNDKKTFEDWSEVLREFCVLSSFYEEYKTVKMIGKGTFARVSSSLYKKMAYFFRYIWRNQRGI